MAFQRALAGAIKVSIVLSPWLVYQPWESFKPEIRIDERTQEFVKEEIKRHNDLGGYNVQLGEWKHKNFGLWNPLWLAVQRQAHLIVPSDLSKRLQMQTQLNEALVNPLNRLDPSHAEYMQMSLQQVLLFDRFSIHHEIGHLMRYDQFARNAILSTGLAIIVATSKYNKTALRIWGSTVLQTCGLLLAVQAFQRHSELQADKYALDNGHFTQEEKVNIAHHWLTLLPQYVYRYPFQEYVASHPSPLMRAQSILNHIHYKPPIENETSHNKSIFN